MSDITTSIDNDQDLTVHTIIGNLQTSDITAKLKEYYTGDKITLKVLWDFTDSDFPDITSSDLRRILYYTREYAHSRAGGKTALVVAKDLGFGLARIFETYADYEAFPFMVRTFRSLEEALDWLDIT